MNKLLMKWIAQNRLVHFNGKPGFSRNIKYSKATNFLNFYFDEYAFAGEPGSGVRSYLPK